MRQKTFSLALCCAVFLFFAGCASVRPPAANRIEHVTILHWNDFHSHDTPYSVTLRDSSSGLTTKRSVGGTAALEASLRHYGKGRPGVIAVNAGDDFQGTPISGITRGASQIALMNLIAPDVATLGNHEFDYGVTSLRTALLDATFPIVTTNLFDSTTGSTFCSASLLRTVGGLRIGFIGLLPPDLDILTLKGNLAGVGLLDVDSVLSATIPVLRRQGAQLIVLVSHMGVDRDTLLASRRHDIDVIVGGHSHTALFTPLRKGRTVVVQAGSLGRYLGSLSLDVDAARDSIVDYRGALTEITPGTFPEDSAIIRKVSEYESMVSRDLDEIIGTLAVDWQTGLFVETNVGDWECDAIRTVTGADVVFVNSGSIRKSIPKGPIRRRDLWELDPFNNSLVRFSVDGRTLKAMLEWQAAGRGELMQVSGIRYAADRNRPDGSRVTEVIVGDIPLRDGQQYAVVTNNYVSGHMSALLGLESAVDVLDLMISDRDVLLDAVVKQGTIATVVEGRIRVISSH